MNKLEKIFKRKSVKYYRRGLDFIISKQYKQAIEAFEQVLRIDHDIADDETYMMLGYAYEQINQYNNAIKSYLEGININPLSFDLYYNLGGVYEKLERYHKAVEAYKKAIVLKPDYAEAYEGIAKIYRDLKLYQKSIDNYLKAIKIKNDNITNGIENDSDNVTNYIFLAHCFKKLLKWEDAVQAYLKLIDIKQNIWIDAYIELGYLYGKLASYDKAKKFLKKL